MAPSLLCLEKMGGGRSHWLCARWNKSRNTQFAAGLLRDYLYAGLQSRAIGNLRQTMFDRLQDIGGNKTTVLGAPKIIDSPVGKAVEFDGVQDAIVDIANKRVALSYDPDKVELSKLEEALSEEGYDVANVM